MKKNTMLILILVTALLTAGCGLFSSGNGQGDPQPGDTIVPPEPEGETVEITLYFANNEYVQTGNENLEKMLTEKRKVTLTNKPLAQTAVEELIKGPRDENMGVVIPSRIKLIDVEVADDIAYVNFASSGMSGGSMEEFFLISSVIMTLTELENVESIQFLVDGKKPETLMGHIYTMDPMDRGDS
ncbi:MAG: GerMN domain-containing protein [Bacillota bacterium]|jgi:spore germination protein GerM|nr:GerMN domain-containing protein [Bacillota bacterium]MDD3297698.1 GerMN domain-containing protein [Bacillota bacterium]MDD3850407.1 GerMN domain-containing protein [Bacillota bacterium]MDD4706602.1 GerMN domain-containing protein [Bacillota bacterium]